MSQIPASLNAAGASAEMKQPDNAGARPGAPDPSVWNVSMKVAAPLLDANLIPDVANLVLSGLVLLKAALRKIGSRGAADGQFAGPCGVPVWNGEVFIPDWWHSRISVHRLSDGSFVRTFGGSANIVSVETLHANYTDPDYQAPPRPVVNRDSLLDKPTAIAACDGLLFIIEQSCHRVTVCKPEDGSLVHRWGSQGDGPTEFGNPGGVAASHGLVYVADTTHGRIQVFRYNGEFVRSITSTPDVQLSPNGVAVFNDLLFVPNANNCIVVLHASDGSFVRHIGKGSGQGNGELYLPLGLACGDGWVAVSEYGNHRISVFSSSDGEFILNFGSKGQSDHELNGPRFMCASDGLLLVADEYNDRVVVYA